MRKLYTLIFTLLLGTSLLMAAVPYVIGGDKNLNLSFYPNPVSKTLNIDVALASSGANNSVDIRIMNMIGVEMIATKHFDLSGVTAHLEIDMSDLPSGVYFLEIKSTVNGAAAVQTKRITKQ